MRLLRPKSPQLAAINKQKETAVNAVRERASNEVKRRLSVNARMKKKTLKCRIGPTQRIISRPIALILFSPRRRRKKVAQTAWGIASVSGKIISEYGSQPESTWSEFCTERSRDGIKGTKIFTFPTDFQYEDYIINWTWKWRLHGFRGIGTCVYVLIRQIPYFVLYRNTWFF